MEYKLHKCGSYNIHTIKTDRFKTIRMEITFRNNLDKEDYQIRNFLFNLLLENNKEYKTKRELLLKQEDLYNASLYASVNKLGASILQTVVIDFLDPSLTKDDYLEEAIKLPFDMIFNPDINNNEFNKESFEIVKKYLENEIKTSIENKSRYAVSSALKGMDKDSISAIDMLGTLEGLDNITNDKLLEAYNNILKHDYVDISIIGNINTDRVIDIINKYANFETIKDHEINYYVENKLPKKVKEITEESDNTQTHLIYILNVNKLTERERDYVLPVFNTILGGGSLETKLYRHVRDEKSLCYSIGSMNMKFDGLILIRTGIDSENINEAKKTIEYTLKDMKNISDIELSRSISSIINNLNMCLDSEGNIIDEYLFNYIFNRPYVDERKEIYKTVTKEEVASLAKRIEINTIYILEGE